jgi:parallel beta-helix repeat protein
MATYAVSYSGTDPGYGASWSGDRVTVHEFGHSFGNLHDEYNSSTPSPVGVTPDGPNCDSTIGCPKWGSPTCIAGCTYNNWYRGDNTGGDLMRTLLNLNFGTVCTNALNTLLSNYPRTLCGGSTPCQCGDILVQNRTLTSSDFNKGACAKDGLEIGAAGITLDCSGKTITGSGTLGSTGIKNPGFDNVTIKNCRLSNFNNGIHASGVLRNVIENNTVSSTLPSGGSGVWIESSNNNNITNNTISSYRWGIALDTNANNNIVDTNNASSCQDGIELYESSLNTLKNNLANKNADGISLVANSDSNTLMHNTADNNTQNGLHADSSSNLNTVNNNEFCFNLIDVNDLDANSGTNNKCDLITPLGTLACPLSCIATTTNHSNSTLGVNVSITSYASIAVAITNATNPSALSPARTIGKFVNITANTSFVSATINISFNASALSVNPASLRMYRWNSTNWSLIANSSVNLTASVVTANVTNTSIFTAIGDLEGGRAEKESALDIIETLLQQSSDRTTTRKLETARKYVTNSLEGRGVIWISENEISCTHGKKVFDYEKRAVKNLQGLLGDGTITCPSCGAEVPAGTPECPECGEELPGSNQAGEVIELLLDADRGLAQKAIDGMTDPQTKQEAQELFDKAEAYRAGGTFLNAIDHYKKAWQLSCPKGGTKITGGFLEGVDGGGIAAAVIALAILSLCVFVVVRRIRK